MNCHRKANVRARFARQMRRPTYHWWRGGLVSTMQTHGGFFRRDCAEQRAVIDVLYRATTPEDVQAAWTLWELTLT